MSLSNGDYILQLTKGFSAVVSECDYPSLSSFKWCAVIRSKLPYAIRFSKGKLISMHRVVMDAPPELQVDHINNDTLDNRRENLRVCSRAENLRNRRSLRGVSTFKGVSPTGSGLWRVDIRAFGRCKYIGTFRDEIEAAHRYDSAARELYGEFASINFKNEPAQLFMR